jgi:hypothetical protein
MTSRRYVFYVLVAAVCALPAAAAAQAKLPAKTPQAYCAALDKSYDRYVGGSHGAERLSVPGYAKAACNEHRPRAAIPVMEQALEGAEVPLPPHRPQAMALRAE